MLLGNRLEKDPFQIYPVPCSVRPWIGQIKEHTYDTNRQEDANLASYDAEYVILVRGISEVNQFI